MRKKIGKAIEKTRIGRNTTPKIISLVFAIVFWIYVMDQVNPEIDKVYNDIPVEIVGIEQIEDDGLVLMDMETHSVSITVAGRRNDLLNFDESMLVVTADIRGYQKGLNTVPIDKRVLMDNITITDISKSDIKVTLDQIISIAKPVVLETTGTLEAGLEIGEIVKDRLEAMVSGPETAVNRVVSVVGNLNITDIQDDFETQISLVPVDMDGNEVMSVTLRDDAVACAVDIDRTRRVPIQPNFISTVQDGYQLLNIEILPSTVQVRGDVTTVNNLRNIMTSEIDLSLYTEPEELEVTLQLPEGIEVEELQSAILANVIVEKVETKAFMFNLNEIAFTNLPEGFNVELLQSIGSIELILSDISSKLESVSRNDIELIVDLADTEPGTTQGTIEVVLPITIRSVELSQEYVNLSITAEE